MSEKAPSTNYERQEQPIESSAIHESQFSKETTPTRGEVVSDTHEANQDTHEQENRSREKIREVARNAARAIISTNERIVMKKSIIDELAGGSIETANTSAIDRGLIGQALRRNAPAYESEAA